MAELFSLKGKIEVDNGNLTKTVDQAKRAILADPQVVVSRAAITGGDAEKGSEFDVYLVDWFVKRAYREFEGALDDSIPSRP